MLRSSNRIVAINKLSQKFITDNLPSCIQAKTNAHAFSLRNHNHNHNINFKYQNTNISTSASSNQLHNLKSNKQYSSSNTVSIVSAQSAIRTTIIEMIKPAKQTSKVPPIADQLLLMPAHKLSKLIKDGSITSQKLCELFAERIKQVNQCTNGMAQDRFKVAFEEAKQIDNLLASLRSGKPESEFSQEELEILHSPLMGVPISVKESIMVKGMCNTGGLWHRRNTIADEDAPVVENAKRFGMIPICTTNVPEGTIYWADCRNKIYGRSLNPYDSARITGASSGGEGALLGGGASVISMGSDIGGSLRIPAHYCGVFSHKPSPFLISPEGHFPSVKGGRLRMFTIGPMCRYASDIRPLLKCLMSDKNNPKKDTYIPHQPENIASIRKDIIQKLDIPNTDLSQLKIHFFNFNEASELKGKQSVHVMENMMEAQREIIDHFSSKFNCQSEHINLDKFLKKTLITFQCILCNGKDAQNYNPRELQDMFAIDNLFGELVKMPLGLSKHTKESLVLLFVGSAMPTDRKKAQDLCEKFEELAAELKTELESILGDNGILIMPTLPTIAYKHNHALLKMSNLRFTSLVNILQLPASHATIRLDKKHKMPYGFSISAKQNNDPLTIAIAEEIELAFGGWTPPTGVADNIVTSTKVVGDHTLTVYGGEKQGQQQQPAQVVV